MSQPDETPADPRSAAAAGEPPAPTRMIRREQQIGYVLAGVSAAAAVSIAAIGGNLLVGALEAGATVLLLLAVRRGHRILTAAAGFLGGLAFTVVFPIELAFLAFSGYLMMRTSNAQAKVRRSQPRLSPAERRAAADARAAARRRRRSGDPAPEASVKTPAANRRYTPPKSKATRRR